jgi:hypothetical protein
MPGSCQRRRRVEMVRDGNGRGSCIAILACSSVARRGCAGMSGKIPCIPKGGARVPELDLLPLHFQLQDVTRVSFGSRDRGVLDRRLRGGEKIRTTLRTRANAESPGTKGRQSFTRYGLAMTTASATTMLVPSHFAGIVRLNASNRSCASRVTPLPRRASRSWIFATVELSRAFNARISRG